MTTHRPSHHGFTMIEIMLVLTMIAVLTAIIAPSFFDSASGTVKQEARLVQKTLRMVSEESQLSGIPIQLRVYPDYLDFFTMGKDQKWQPISNAVLQPYQLNPPVQFSEALLDGDIGMTLSTSENNPDTPADKKTPPPLARFLFWPDGSLTSGTITMRLGDRGETRQIRLDPGPAGIHLAQAAN